MAQEFELKISKDILQEKLSAINTRIGGLNNIMTRYQNLLNTLDRDVMETSDSEFQKTEENVRQNIKMVQSSLNAAEAARKACEEALKQAEDYHSRGSQALSGAMDTAQTAASKAVEAFKSYD